jgi:hypothetical protein
VFEATEPSAPTGLSAGQRNALGQLRRLEEQGECPFVTQHDRFTGGLLNDLSMITYAWYQIPFRGR